MEEGEKKRRVVVESLGWLTESSIMPKKHRAIVGVGASSILDLKAQLYQSQEESKKTKELNGPDGVEYIRAKKKIAPRDSFSIKNSGVDARDVKDKLELKAIKDGKLSHDALVKKAQLYDKLVRGEVPDEEDKEKYCVDFFRKGLEHEDAQQPEVDDRPDTAHPEAENGEGNASSPFTTRFVAPGGTAATVDRNEHKRIVREVHEEANQAREKASELKLRRQEQAEARRQKLRQAYLRKKLEKLKEAAANTGST